MKIKKNWREYSLITLGILIILTSLVATDFFTELSVVLGIAVALIGAWPLFPKRKLQNSPEQKLAV